jgi:predicted nucleotidyltransferase
MVRGTAMTLLERYARLLDRLLAELRAHYGEQLVAVAVFGSVARETPREDSDVDLLVVARDLPAGRLRRVDGFLPVEDRLEGALREVDSSGAPISLSPVFKTPAEVEQGSPLFLDMVEDARILYDPDGFLTRYLAGFRARLAALGARRIWRGNAWYWELKPDLRPGEVFTL